jgi:hypothetical protein
MKVWSRCLIAVLLLQGSALAQPTAGQADEAKTRASALMQEATRAYQAGRYTEALSGFEQAYALFPSPRILFNLGQASERLGRYAEATEAFERFLSAAGNAPTQARAEAERSLEEMRDKVGQVEMVCGVGGAEVMIDGRSFGRTPLARTLVVAVGPHQVVVQKEGFAPFLRRIEAVGGTIARVEVQLVALPPAPAPVSTAPPPSTRAPALVQPLAPAPAAPPSPTLSRKVAIGALVSAPLLAGTGLVFGSLARGQAERINSACQDGCAGAEIVENDRARRRYGTTQWVLLGTAAAAVTGGALLYFLAPPRSPGEPAAVGLMLNGGGAQLALGARF